jgi:hypothetical protein
MPAAMASAGDRATSGRSSSRISPASGRCSPKRMFMSVVLPAPFSPSSAWTSPLFTVRSTPSTATTPGHPLVMPRSSTFMAVL